jgi:hypothetical protein
MTAESRNTGPISRQRSVNTFPKQPKHALASTMPGPSLGNSPLNMLFTNGAILGSGVLYWVRRVEYLHRDPASRRRRRKGESQM